MSPDFWKNALIALPIAIGMLTALEWYNQQYWLFAVTGLVGWCVADFLFRILQKQGAVNVIDFVGFIIVVIMATAAGAYISNALVNSQKASEDQLISALMINFVAASLAYVESSYEVQEHL
jgi:hypothetical protein